MAVEELALWLVLHTPVRRVGVEDAPLDAALVADAAEELATERRRVHHGLRRAGRAARLPGVVRRHAAAVNRVLVNEDEPEQRRAKPRLAKVSHGEQR